LADIREEYSFVTNLEKNLRDQTELLALSEKENDTTTTATIANE